MCYWIAIAHHNEHHGVSKYLLVALLGSLSRWSLLALERADSVSTWRESGVLP